MPKDDERGYFERRAEKELLMAAATNDPNACASHYQLANLYLGLVYSDDGTAEVEAA